MKFAAFILALCSLASAECKMPFSIVFKDDLNNVSQHVSPDTEKWLTQKMSKKYPGVCYVEGAPPLVFFVSRNPAVYRGIKTVNSSGTVRDSDTGQRIATTETEQAVNQEVEYHKIYLSLETQNSDGQWRVMHNFQGKTLHNTMYGFCTSNCHPEQKLFEEAIKWLHDGGLADSKQSVLY